MTDTSEDWMGKPEPADESQAVLLDVAMYRALPPDQRQSIDAWLGENHLLNARIIAIESVRPLDGGKFRVTCQRRRTRQGDIEREVVDVDMPPPLPA